MNLPSGEDETHESYGLISLSRISSSKGMNLFGSAIQHGNYIALRIAEAIKYRDLNRDRYMPGKQLIEVLLSPTQFAEFITTMNIGSGVPCTIQNLHGRRMPECPDVQQREIFEEEFEKSAREAVSEAHTLLESLKKTFAKASVGKGDREQIIKDVERVVMMVESRLPWIQQSFNEAMDHAVVSAKGEVEAFVTDKIQSLGIDALKEQVQAALTVAQESPVLKLSKTESP